MSGDLTATYLRLESLLAELREHEKSAAARTATLRAQITETTTLVNRLQVGLDVEKIALAERVLEIRGTFDKAGEDRLSVRNDAISAIVHGGTKLVRDYFGTKNYDRWHGQRCDCEYGMGPGHGSIIFSIGLRRDVRARTPFALSAAEIDSALYYLTHLSAIQSAAQPKAAA